MPRPSGKVGQRTSHRDLYIDRSASSTGRRSGRIDAVVVPASRPASYLVPAIELAATHGALLVALCSRQAAADQVIELAGGVRGARIVALQVPDDWSHPDFPCRTSDPLFRNAQFGRQTDLSSKRNIGLVLSRLMGWNKIVFLDDDIIRTDGLARLAGQLDAHHVAGMVVRQHPDNSVVCHARRLAGANQDVFISGAVLGVHTGTLPLPFFPDVYNEDWFSFARQAAARDLPRAGQATQLTYDPFRHTDRARWEEFGDLLAEGLYALFSEAPADKSFGDLLKTATAAYWDNFIEVRHEVLVDTHRAVLESASRHLGDPRLVNALASLNAAQSQLKIAINPQLCANFLESWQDDLGQWQRYTNRIKTVRDMAAAMEELQLTARTYPARGAVSIGRPSVPAAASLTLVEAAS